jgi:CelD/BcsL family acetyltransferase involved in cellulose biosynthesis
LDRLREKGADEQQGQLLQAVSISGFDVKIYNHFSSIEKEWRQLETEGVCSFYQTYDWCSSFYECIGRGQGLQICVVAAYDAQGKLTFILPLQIRTRYRFRLLEWLAQAENNYGHGLFDRQFSDETAAAWFNQNLAAILNAIPAYDVVNLQNTPLGRLGLPDIFGQASKSTAANSSYVTQLMANYEKLLQSKRSAKSISKIRRRDERILELGNVEFCVEPTGTKTSAALVEAFLHKKKQLSQMGISDAFGIPQQKFLLRLANNKLTQSNHTISSIIGAEFNNRFWLMITSLSSDAPRPLSPGDMLLRKTIAWCCAQNLEAFDFSNGEIGYKTLWADETVVLYNYIAARNLRGLPVAGLLRFYHCLKRTIKASDFWRTKFNAMRQKLRGHA